MGLVSLVDQDRQWLKARCGIDVEQTRRDEAFCAYTILSNSVLIVEDACLDLRFFDKSISHRTAVYSILCRRASYDIGWFSHRLTLCDRYKTANVFER